MLIKPTNIPYAEFDYYYAGTRTNYAEELLTELEYCRLLSYVNNRTLIEKHCKNGRAVFVDSGAYTAMTQGTEIDIDKYIDWLNTWSENIEKFCCLDVIPTEVISTEQSAKLTWENYLYMYERLNEPHKLVYCFHRGESVDYLRKALEFGCKYIALGGVAHGKRAERREFFEQVQDEFTNYPNVHVHAFGVSDVKLLTEFTFIHGADSTSWLFPAKWSETQHKCKSKVYWSGRNPEKQHHINNLTDEQYFELEDELALHGFTPEQMYGEDDAIKNRDAWQILFWQEKFIPVRGQKQKN